jgi:hypothetical protein
MLLDREQYGRPNILQSTYTSRYAFAGCGSHRATSHSITLLDRSLYRYRSTCSLHFADYHLLGWAYCWLKSVVWLTPAYGDCGSLCVTLLIELWNLVYASA